MLSQELTHDLDNDFLNMDAFWTNNDECNDDFWTATQSRHAHGGSSQDEAVDLLDDEDLDPILNSSSSKTSAAAAPLVSPRQPVRIKDEVLIKTEPHHHHHHHAAYSSSSCCHDHGDDDGHEEDEEDEAEVASRTAWLDPVVLPGIERKPSLSLPPPTSTSTTSVLKSKRKLSRDKGDLDPALLDDPDDEQADDGENDDPAFFLSEEDYTVPDFTTGDDSTEVSLSPKSTAASAGSDAMPRQNVPRGPSLNASFGLTSPPLVLPSTSAHHPHHHHHPSGPSLFINDQDIPDMVNLFSSMYTPADAHDHARAVAAFSGAGPLSIMVPTPQMYSTMFPFAAALHQHQQQQQHQHQQHQQAAAAAAFEYFTPPGLSNSRFLENANGTSIFLNAADSLSPATKPPTAQSTSAATAAAAAAFLSANPAAAAAAAAMANSAAAINTMRKLNTTYGVPIAPLQRSIPLELPLKPKGGASTTATITTNAGSSAKVAKIQITPDISDFKLVQIFHNFCDPVTKLLQLPKFQQLLQVHQIKEDPATRMLQQQNKDKPNETVVNPNSPIAQEATALFKILDTKQVGYLDLEKFMNSFQICNRCTEAKRRAHSAFCASQGQSFVATALERQLMEDVAPVIVRVVPTSYEGPKVKSCEHYQWTWCEGFEKTGNEKCKGTNRHDKCPKYLANCTLWKHKLPPKNRKAKVFENQESPSKKFKHFA